MLEDPKSKKKTVKSCSFLCFQDLQAYKLRVNTLMKLTLGGGGKPSRAATRCSFHARVGSIPQCTRKVHSLV